MVPALVRLEARVAIELTKGQPWIFRLTVWPAAIFVPLMVLPPPSPRRSKVLAPEPVKFSVDPPLTRTGLPLVVPAPSVNVLPLWRRSSDAGFPLTEVGPV